MGNVSVQCAPLERLERLSGPSQLIAEGHPDPLGPIIERKNSSTFHECTAARSVRPAQRPFPTPHPVLAGSFPPACAISGLPPPVPPTSAAISLMRSPAFNRRNQILCDDDQ